MARYDPHIKALVPYKGPQVFISLSGIFKFRHRVIGYVEQHVLPGIALEKQMVALVVDDEIFDVAAL